MLLLTVLTAFIAAALWLILYAVAFWLTLLGLSAALGVEAHPPKHFTATFIISAALLVLLTWVAKRRRPDERARDDKTLLEITCEFITAVPRATLAVWGNASAWQRLTDRELELATAVIARVADAERLPIYQLPLEIPDPVTCDRVVLALQLTGLVELRRKGEMAFLSLSRDAKSALPA